MPPSRWERLRAQGAAWNADRAEHGPRHATVLRIRRLLDLGPVTTGRVDQMSDQIEVLRGRSEHLDHFSRDIAGAAADAADEAATARDASAALVDSEHAHRVFEQVWSTTAWLDAVHVAEDALISVVLPTRGTRTSTLERAVGSVRVQGYGRWQLVVVVDGDEATVSAVGADLPDDDRIDVIRSPGEGVSAARNAGLAAARGELIAYLDDDNVMGPQWLRAIAWASMAHPDTDLFYGAELIDDPRERGRDGSLPTLHLVPFDRRRLEVGNYIDQNTVAHRSSLLEAHYDESLPANVDWDFLLRATVEHAPEMIPVVASCYTTTARDRLTGSDDAARSWVVVRERARSNAPLRVLAYNQMYPLVSEAYIGEELDALAAQGAEIACCVFHKRSAPVPIDYPVFIDLAQAIEQHRPDVILTHWAPASLARLETLGATGIPYAVRGHSFAGEVERMRRILADPSCVGIWCFPDHVFDDSRVHALPTLFTGWDRLPPPADERDLVLSVSAGLPKKDFPLLVDAFAALPGIERRIVVGTTQSFESIVGDLVLATQELDDPPLVQANVDRKDVFELLARSAVLVYTLTPESGFGMPMSIVEAMTSGLSVIAPDRPEVARAFGPDIRAYRTADDIAEHVRTVLAGGPAIDAERERNRVWARERFCDPELGKRFYAELADAVSSFEGIG